MEGYSHALSGAVTGGAAGVLLLHLPVAQTALLAGLAAGAAVLPDMDHPDSSLAWSFGFLTRALAWCTGKVCGGHRHGSHTVIAAAVVTGLAWLAVNFRHDMAGRIGLGVLLALILAGAMTALRLAGHWRDIVAIAGAAAMIVTGTGLGLVAIAAGTGYLTHLAGDMLTDSGVPVLLPFTCHRFRWWGEPLAFTTGTLPERMIVDPLLIAACGALIWAAAH